MGESVNAMIEGRAIFTPIKEDKGVTQLLLLRRARQAGGPGATLWDEIRGKQMAFKPLLVSATSGPRHRRWGFTADPTSGP